MKQKELIQNMLPKELRKNVIYTQILLLGITVTLSFILFNNMTDWLDLFKWDISQIIIYGIGSGLFIVLIEYLLVSWVPKTYFDDVGVNEKIFRDSSIFNIFLLTILISISEEMLFRGLIQTTFGFWIASILFVLVHTRYLLKPVLLIFIILMSLFFGLLYELTENLIVTIATHFTIDFILGLLIRSFKWGNLDGEKCNE